MPNVFPRSANTLPLQIIVAVVLLLSGVSAFAWYYFTPKASRVGYMPNQPVAYDHSFHVGELGLDCRYCHTHVDKSGHANVPESQTCMNCHSIVKKDSPALAPIRESYASGNPVEWVRIHKVPDYVYFNHAVHVNRGISCVECHGRVDEMEVVWHDQPLSMGWCLECHRNPEDRVRPESEIYNLAWEPVDEGDHKEWAEAFVHDNKVNPPQSCSGCHR